MDVAAFVANIFVLAVLTWQVHESRVQRHEDHLRRRGQATIEFYSTTRTTRQALQDAVEETLGRDTLTEARIAELHVAQESGDEEADRALKAIRAHLAGLEWIATGANTGVYDVEILNRLAGGHIIYALERYSTYIRHRRRVTGQTNLYIELEEFVTSLRKLRYAKPSRGGALAEPRRRIT